MARHLAGLDMNVFVCDYDHNAPSAEYLQQTPRRLFQAVRDARPELPIILISSPGILKQPEQFAPRRKVIWETYQWALEQGDRNVYFIDGAELFSGECWDSCTVAGVHPNDFGFYRMAMRIEKSLKPILK